MSLPALAPQWLVLTLLALLAIAGIEDALRLRISNILSVSVLLLGIVAIFVAGPRIAVWENVVVFIAMLVVGTMLFSARKLGGGDVKLLASTALWFDFEGALRLIAAVTVAGGVLAILILAARTVRLTGGGEKARVVGVKAGIPYGVAIAAGAAIAVLMLQPKPRPDPLKAPIPFSTRR